MFLPPTMLWRDLMVNNFGGSKWAQYFPDSESERYCPVCEKYLSKTEFYKKKSPGLKNELTRLCRKHHSAKSYRSRQKYHGSTRSEYNRRLTLKKYGLTVEGYDAMYEAQKGLCAICGQPEIFKKNYGESSEPRMLPVDHDHKTGKPRKLLCSNCNLGIGNFKESVELLLAAAEYLKSYQSNL